MTNKEIELLLLDLSYRLLHGVKFHYFSEFADGEDPEFDNTITVIDIADWQILDEDHKEWIRVRQIMPYLRPMSSMTEEEREEFRKVGGVMSYSPQHDTWAISAFAPEAYDWLNKNKFDYRGLIPMGLALEAPEDMYKNF